MSLFPKGRPTKAAKRASLPRLTKGWQRRTHVFVDSGMTDYAGEAICGVATCGFLETHVVHDLTQSVDLSEVDNRILGERE